MNCLACKTKNCKNIARDCNGRRTQVLQEYGSAGTRELYAKADELVSGGKAGDYSRIEEIIMFAKSSGYRKLSLAYCFSMEGWAGMLSRELELNGFKVDSVRCTVNGIKEQEIVPALKDSVNCNPIGQAEELNASDTDLVLEMGLCLGHDIIFHSRLQKPFTVLFVKDRKFGNIPQKHFDSRNRTAG